MTPVVELVDIAADVLIMGSMEPHSLVAPSRKGPGSSPGGGLSNRNPRQPSVVSRSTSRSRLGGIDGDDCGCMGCASTAWRDDTRRRLQRAGRRVQSQSEDRPAEDLEQIRLNCTVRLAGAGPARCIVAIAQFGRAVPAGAFWKTACRIPDGEQTRQVVGSNPTGDIFATVAELADALCRVKFVVPFRPIAASVSTGSLS